MTEQQNLTNAEPIREAYSAPICKCFTFETSGLAQMSGEPGFMGSKVDASTAKNEW